MRSREEVEALLREVLSKASAPECNAGYHRERSIATRFGDNAITQNMDGEAEHIYFESAFGRRHADSISNRLDAASLGRLVERVESIARVSPEDPEFMPPLPAQTYPEGPPRFCAEAAAITAGHMAEGIRETVALARSKGLDAAGLYQAEQSVHGYATSAGLFAFDEHTLVEFSVSMHGPSGSGTSAGMSESAARVDVERVAREAMETAVAAQDPEELEPGDYNVILEPRAVADLLLFLFLGLSARDAEEGTTVFAGRVGQAFMNEKVTLSVEVDREALPTPPFGQDGLPARRTVWVDRGVVKRLHHDRYWAEQKGTEPDPLNYPMCMAGEDRSVADLVASCERGLLVKRLWYIRYVDSKSMLLTGMTRDGLFLVEGGRIVKPVKNLRFNESPVVMLQNVEALSRPERVGRWSMVPGILSRDFSFSSKTDSI